MALRDSRAVTLILVGLVLLAGCSGAGSSGGGSGDAATAGSAEVEADGEAPAKGGDGGGDSSAERDASLSLDAAAQAGDSRARIRTGRMELEVGSFDNASARLRELARERGGFVASTERRVRGSGNRTWVTGQLVLRIPSENFSAVYNRAGTVGVVRSASSDSKDVTEQLVDLNARIENLKTRRDRLRTLYERANDTDDVLEVGRELSEVQGEIERLEAQRRSLRDKVALSTLTIELHEPRPETEVRQQVPFHETGLVAAFLSSVNGVVVTVKTFAVAFAYTVPYLFAFGVPLVGLTALAYRRLRP